MAVKHSRSTAATLISDKRKDCRITYYIIENFSSSFWLCSWQSGANCFQTTPHETAILIKSNNPLLNRKPYNVNVVTIIYNNLLFYVLQDSCDYLNRLRYFVAKPVVIFE